MPSACPPGYLFFTVPFFPACISVLALLQQLNFTLWGQMKAHRILSFIKVFFFFFKEVAKGLFSPGTN